MEIFQIASVPGDGIGKETVTAGGHVLDTLCEVHGGLLFEYLDLDWSCEYYLKHGRMMPDDGLAILRPCDAVYLGAVGFPGVPDHVSLWGLLLPIRRTFRQYINLRPVILYPGVETPLKDKGPEDIDYVVVRENSGGVYTGTGGIFNRTTTITPPPDANLALHAQMVTVQVQWNAAHGGNRNVVVNSLTYERW